MSGLVELGMMKGFGDGMSTIGNFMMQQRAREEDRNARFEERKFLQEERLDARRDQLAAGRASSGPFMTSMPEDGMTEEMAAARMNMTIPEFRQFRRMQKTGDSSSYDKDITTGAVDDSNGDPYAPTVTTKTEKGKPAGFDQWAADKRRVLADIQAELTFGDKYDDVVRGRRGQQEIDASTRAEKDPTKAGMIGQAMAAGAGKPLNAQGVNSYTGEANEVGESTITKNEAAAKKAAAGGDGKAVRVSSTKVIDGRTVAIMSDGTTRDLGAGNEDATNRSIANIIIKKSAADFAFKRLPVEEQRRIAVEILLGSGGGSGNNGNVKSPSAASPGASAAGGGRPPLSSFRK